MNVKILIFEKYLRYERKIAFLYLHNILCILRSSSNVCTFEGFNQFSFCEMQMEARIL